MHEMSLCEGILRILEEQARTSAFTRVRTVWVEVGALSTVVPEALDFAWGPVTRGTVAEGSRLEIIPVPGAAWCMMCEETVAIASRVDPCPKCGGYKLAVTGGDDLRVKEMEVE